jgi:3-hydroxyisobutyrate dehydrogenase-like beta-hydroxyacid dehydrogenase
LEPIVNAFADIYLYLGAFGAASKIKFINNLLAALSRFCCDVASS